MLIAQAFNYVRASWRTTGQPAGWSDVRPSRHYVSAHWCRDNKWPDSVRTSEMCILWMNFVS